MIHIAMPPTEQLGSGRLPIHVLAPIVNTHAAPHNGCRVLVRSSFCAARSKVGRVRRRVREAERTPSGQTTTIKSHSHGPASPPGTSAHRLIAEAWGVQLNQVLGPGWIDHPEYDIVARTTKGTAKEQMAPMIRNLLVERFRLREHSETRTMRVYELAIAKTGLKIRPNTDGETVNRQPDFISTAECASSRISLPCSSLFRRPRTQTYRQEPAALRLWSSTRLASRASSTSAWNATRAQHRQLHCVAESS